MHEEKAVFEAAFCHDIGRWADETADEAFTIFTATMADHISSKTIPFLGAGSVKMYQFLRNGLQVPFLRISTSESSNIPLFQGLETGTTLGTFTSRVFRALRHGSAMVPVMECLRDALGTRKE